MPRVGADTDFFSNPQSSAGAPALSHSIPVGPHTASEPVKAVCVLKGDSPVTGTVTFSVAEGGVVVEYELKGLKEGKHGFHVQ